MLGLARAQREDVHIVALEPMRVAVFRAVGKEPEHVSTGYLKRWLLDQRLRDPRAVRIFGYDVELPEAEQKKGLRGYEAWATVPGGVRPSQGVRIRNVPGGLYAVMRIHDALADPFARIPPGWQRLWGWVKDSREYRLTDGLCLEEHVQGQGCLHLDLFIPVVPAARARPVRAPRRVPR